MRLRRPLTTAAALSALGLGVCGLTGTATAAGAGSGDDGTTRYDGTMLSVMADAFGTTTAEAAERLDREQAQGAAVTALSAEGVRVDGAFVDGERLVVQVPAAQAPAALAAGLTPRTSGPGQAELERAAAEAQQAVGTGHEQVQAYVPDLQAQQVTVTVDPGADAALVERLEAVELVEVVTGEAEGLAPTADVVPGRIMDLDPGTNCSLGFPGTTSDGNNVLLTAGHCVEGLPDVLDASGEHIGVGVDSRFASGRPSVDMGLMDIDAEDTGVGYVDTRNGSTVAVTGTSSAPVGTAICKAGNTTGWTCGQIEAYGLTVNYGDGLGGVTPTSGLARASVCTEGGDSGGAYISGTTAQGMTSGGPVGVDCGFNGGDVGSYSFYQPVTDAASYYGVSVTTG